MRILKAMGMVLAFILTVVLATPISFKFIGDNVNAPAVVCFPLICAIPLILIAIPILNKKTTENQLVRYILPISIFPILFALFLGYMLYIQSPENIYKDFLGDPIPAEVTNIQAHNITSGFDGIEVVIAFNSSSPSVIEQIIAKNKLELDNNPVGQSDMPLQYFPNIDPNQNWELYKRFNESPMECFFLWVNPEKNLAIFRFLSG